MHKLDVIVITYNRTDLLEKTFHSVCSQTYNNCVIKLFNNGGTAINADFIKPFQKQYPDKKIEYHSVLVNCQGEQGYKNICALMEAEYVVLFHDDDLFHPYYLENAMTALQQNPDTVLLISLALCSSHPDELPYDRHIRQGSPKYCVGNDKVLAAMYFMGCNLCFPSTIYKTDIYKNNRFDWDPYKKYGDRPATLYYASFGKILILLENYMYYRIHAGQDRVRQDNAVHCRELYNYYSLYKNILCSSGLLYRKIWKYYSKNFVKLVSKANDLQKKEFSHYYRKNLFYPNSFFKKRKNYWTSRFEKLFLPDMTIADIFALNNEDYVMPERSRTGFVMNKEKRYWLQKLFSIEKTFDAKGRKRKILYLLGLKICLKKYNNLLKDVQGKDNAVSIENSIICNWLKITIRGNNNTIKLKDVYFQGSGEIVVFGHHHTVEITNEWIGKNLSVFINPSLAGSSGSLLPPCEIRIEGGTVEDLSIVNPHGGTGVTIAQGHMISTGVSIQNTDSHPIYDCSSRTIINKPSAKVEIAENCWLGMNVTILKEVSLARGTIVGYGAVVTKPCLEQNCVIAGVPAKIVKHNVFWKQSDEDFF